MSTISGIPSSSTGNYWEKTLSDVNDVDESFANARDMGYTRLNYARVTTVGKLANNDTSDIYKISVQSNGKLSVSLRNDQSEDEEKVLDLSKYDQALNELKQQIDPEGYAKEKEEKEAEEAKKKLIEYTAPGMRLEVYIEKNGRQTLIGDSEAEEGSKLRETLESILKGEYKASKGTYYFKVSRDDTVKESEQMSYAMQIMQGTTYKHDYVLTESSSQDTKNKTTSRVPSTSSNGTLSSVNALQVQAARYQATAQMLQVGYLNMASIYSKNSSY